ncbi:MAG: hypothetical protein K2L87_02640, partial [Clostridiales bacterium]|nr:hypothetical protein [Clostridiales bacterium]
NKCDQWSRPDAFPHDYVCISARSGQGLEQLKTRIMEKLKDEFIRTTLFVPFADMAQLSILRPYYFEQSVSYTDDGSEISAIIPTIYAEKFKKYI